MTKSINCILTLIFIILILGIFSAGCKSKKKDYDLETFQISDSGWGYKIYKQKTPFIVQYNIPAIPKKIIFKTKEDASKVGSLMIQKLEQNQMPSITVSELDSMEILYN